MIRYLDDVVPDDDNARLLRLRSFLEREGSCFREAHARIVAGMPALSEGPSLLPSFLHLITTLQQHGRDFRVVFRTFGNDLPFVAAKWNEFVMGRNPAFPDFQADGTNGTRDLTLDTTRAGGALLRTSQGFFFRTDGVFEQPKLGDAAAIHTWITGAQESTGSATAFWAQFDQWVHRHSVCAVRDHYGACEYYFSCSARF